MLSFFVGATASENKKLTAFFSCSLILRARGPRRFVANSVARYSRKFGLAGRRELRTMGSGKDVDAAGFYGIRQRGASSSRFVVSFLCDCPCHAEILDPASTQAHAGQLVSCALAHEEWEPIDPCPVVYWRRIETLTEPRVRRDDWLASYGWVASCRDTKVFRVLSFVKCPSFERVFLVRTWSWQSCLLF